MTTITITIRWENCLFALLTIGAILDMAFGMGSGAFF